MRKTIFIFAIIMILGIAGAAEAQITFNRPSPKKVAGVPPSVAGVFINMQKPDGSASFPDRSQFSNLTNWIVVARSADNPQGIRVDIASVEPQQTYDQTGQVLLSFVTPLAKLPALIDISLVQPKMTTVTWKPKKEKSSIDFYPVEKSEDADVYLFGSWTAVHGDKPSYNLDTVVGTPGLDRGLWRYSFSGKAKTADKPDYDVDSFEAAFVVERIYPFDSDETGPFLDLKWDAAKWEFNRKDVAYNFVSAPTVTESFDLWTKISQTDYSVKAAVNFDLRGGVEAGRNLKNEIVPEGYGAIFRVVPGAALYAVFPKALGIQEVRWTTDYRARILTTREPFTDTRGEDRTSIARGTRHDLTDELALQLTKLIGVSIKHEFGSQPPAFKILDHRVTVGLTIMWAWNE